MTETIENIKWHALTHGKIHAGFVEQKQLPALLILIGGQTTAEHEVRTNLTAVRYVQF